MSAPLDYAPPQPWYRRRFLRRLAFWLLLLAAIAIPAKIYGPRIYDRCVILYWQNRCMNYQFPAGTLVGSSFGDPMELDKLNDLSSELLDDCPSYLRFLHARSCAAGKRLIIIRGDSAFPIYSLFKPANLSADPELVGGRFSPIENMPDFPDGTRNYAAQPDPADDSAILIPLDFRGIRHTIHIHLNPAGNELIFDSITPPL